MPYPGADHRVEPVGQGGAVRQAVRLLVVGLLAGLLLGAVPLRQWTESLPDNPGSTALRGAAASWEAATGRLGLNRFYTTARAALRGLQAVPGPWPAAKD